jgi:threonine dehydratase
VEHAVTDVTLDAIREARERLGEHVRRTPLLSRRLLSERVGATVHLKCEHLQRTGSFKLRGALNLISQLTPEEAARGVAAVSAGNHAQGVAVAAAERGIHARIFMPSGAPISKVLATRSYGADVELVDGGYAEASEVAHAWAAEHDATFIHPFDDPRVIAGQGTIALELLEQLPDVRTVIAPVGGGGLISGLAVALKALRPECAVIGVQAAGCNSLGPALDKGGPTYIDSAVTIADGIAVRRTGALTFDIIRQHLDELVVVEDEAISAAIVELVERGKQVIEPAAATTVAALDKLDLTGRGPVGCILTGGNIDPALLTELIHHGLSASGRYLSFWTMLPDRPGELTRFSQIVSDLRINVISIEHHRAGVMLPLGKARLDVVVQTRGRDQADELITQLEARGYEVWRR